MVSVHFLSRVYPRSEWTLLKCLTACISRVPLGVTLARKGRSTQDRRLHALGRLCAPGLFRRLLHETGKVKNPLRPKTGLLAHLSTPPGVRPDPGPRPLPARELALTLDQGRLSP